MVNGVGVGIGDVVDAHTSVVEADCEQVRMFGVEIETHDSRLGGVDELGVGRILERVNHDHSVRLLHKIVCNSNNMFKNIAAVCCLRYVLRGFALLTRPVADGEHVEVFGTPADGGDGELLRLFASELPQWKQSSFLVAVLVTCVLVVLEI